MKRQSWEYKGCKIHPFHQDIPKYFGNANYPKNPTQYRTHFWMVIFPDNTYCYCGDKAETRKYIDVTGYRRGVNE